MENKTIQVTTTDGPVIGKIVKTVLNDEINVFHRIPYIQPPVGELRFKDPQPVKPWTTPIDGTMDGEWPPGLNLLIKETFGDENSIQMNVYTRNLKPDKLAPIMVYIPGGAFMRGSSSVELYAPDFLLQKNIVLFSFNYRLGALGFLSLDDPKLGVPGNAGFKDQNMALKWIKKNAKIFGGDPDNITLVGESAGGCSVHYHMLSELSKGTFHRAIVMSGVVLNNWSVLPRIGMGLRLAKAFGWDETGGEKGALDVLMKVSSKEIIHVQETLLTPEEKRNLILFSFGPVVEPYAHPQCFIPKNPLEMMKNAWSDNLPIMIGGTSDEGIFCFAAERIFERPDFFDKIGDGEYLVPDQLGLDRKSEKCKEIGRRIKKKFWGDEVPSMATMKKYFDIMSDRMFLHGIHQVVQARVQNKNAGPTYYYRFNFDSERFNHYRIITCGPKMRGVCHADDLSYLFKNKFFEKTGGLPVDSPEYKTVQRMVGMWTSFVINGNPNCPEIKPVIWEPLATATPPFKCLNISDQVSFIDHPETDRELFWEQIFSEVQNA